MEWQPIDTAPKDGTIVLLFGESHYGGQAIETGYYVEQWAESWETVKSGNGKRTQELRKTDSGYWDANLSPTHWIPLPPPPDRGA